MKIRHLCLLGLLGTWSLQGKSDPSPKKNLDSGEQVVTSDHFDFGETPIDGTAKMPPGSFLEGRKAQRLKSMLKLRTDFSEKVMEPQKTVK